MANRYFVGAIDADWNDVGNWDTVSGGPGGASVPGAGDTAIFDGSSPNCNVDMNVILSALDVQAGYAAQLDFVTFDFATSNFSVAGGTVLCGTGNVGGIACPLVVSGGVLDMETATPFNCSTLTFTGGNVTLTTSVLQIRGNADFNCAVLNAPGGYIAFYTAAPFNFVTRGKTFAYVTNNGSATLTQVGDLYALSLEVGNSPAVWDCNDFNVDALVRVTCNGTGSILGRSGSIRCRGTWNTTIGTWTPGTGTVEAWADAAHLAQQVTGNTTFNNFTVGSTAPGANATLTLTGTVTVSGTFDYNGIAGNVRYITGGTIRARGSVTNAGGLPIQGTTTLIIDGNVNQLVRFYGGINLTVDKTGGSCIFTYFNISPTSNAVTITFDASADWVTNGTLFRIIAQGLDITLAGLGGLTTITVPTCNINLASVGAAHTVDLGGLLIACTGNNTYSAGYGGTNRRMNNGRIEVGGNLTVDIADNGAYTGTAVFRMVGAVDRTINFSGRGQDRYWNPLEIAKTGGATVTLLDALGTRGAGQNLTVTSGVLDLAGFPITVGGTFSVAAGATLRARGDEVITATLRTYNATSNVVLYNAAVTALLNNLGLAFGNLDLGPALKLVETTAATTITIAGTLAATGGAPATPVYIRSTVPGTWCYWTLTGASALGDNVDVADNNASGGIRILALGSADLGHNVNWFFAGGGGGKHLRLNYSHGFPEGFTGGMVPRDFLSYADGMPGMGGAGSGGGALPAFARRVVGISTTLAAANQARYSIDGGVLWTNSAWAPALAFGDFTVALLSLGGASLLAFVASGATTKVYRSGDTGATFTQVGVIVAGAAQLIASPIVLPSGRIILGIHDALGADYRCAYSDDNGATWTAVVIAAGDAATYYYSTAHIARQADGKLCTLVITAIGASRIYYSADNGATWNMGNTPFNTNNIAIFRHPDGTLGSIRATGALFTVYRHLEAPAGTWSAVLVATWNTAGGGNPCGAAWLDAGDGLSGKLFQHRNDVDQVDVYVTADGGATWNLYQSLGGAVGVAFVPSFNAPFYLNGVRWIPYDNQPTSVNDPISWRDAGAGFAVNAKVVLASPPIPAPAGIVVS